MITATSFAKDRILSSLGLKTEKRPQKLEDPPSIIESIDSSRDLSRSHLGNDLSIETAKSLISQGELNMALGLLLKLAETSPDNLECLRILGALLLGLQQPRVAEEVLYAAVKLSNWTDAISIANLAEAVRLNNDTEVAMRIAFAGLRSLNESHHDFSQASILRYTIGRIYEDKNIYETAAEWYLTAALIDSLHVEAWLKASTMQFPEDHRNATLAINVLSEGVKRNADNKQLLYSLGIALHMTGKVEEAIVFYSRVLDIDPDEVSARLALAAGFESIGKPNHAVTVLEELLSPHRDGNVATYIEHIKVTCGQGSSYHKAIGKEYIKRLLFHNYEVAPTVEASCA